MAKSEDRDPIGATPLGEREAEVRRQVRSVLERASAYPRMDSRRRETVANGVAHMVLLVADRREEIVDFPLFVADLIAGTFEAVVNASIQQMEAYAEMIENVSKVANQFVSRATSDASRRQRQHLLATMALMGMTRLEIGRRSVRERKILGEEKDEDD